MVKYTTSKIIELIEHDFANKKILLLAPVIKGRKGHYQELFEQYRRKGYLYARINGVVKELTFGMKLDRYKTHTIEIVIDKLKISENDTDRIKQSIETAMKIGKHVIMILDTDTNVGKYYSKN